MPDLILPVWMLVAEAPAQRGPGIGDMLPAFAIIGVLFYLMIIRPQQKQLKSSNQMRETLKNGDEVVTSSGIYGTVKEVQEQAVVIEISPKTNMKVVKGHIVQNLTQNLGQAPGQPVGR